MNELILLCELVAVFTLLLIAKRLFGKAGVIAWVPIATVLANIITAKNAGVYDGAYKVVKLAVRDR